MRRDAGRPHDRLRRDLLTGREATRVLARLLQPGAETDVDAAAAKLAYGVVGEPLVDLGQDTVHRLDQDPAHPCQASARVAVDRVGGEVLKLGECFQAGVATAHEDVGQELLAALGVLRGVGALERVDHVVAEPDRVGEALEPDRVLVEPGHGSERDTEPTATRNWS